MGAPSSRPSKHSPARSCPPPTRDKTRDLELLVSWSEKHPEPAPSLTRRTHDKFSRGRHQRSHGMGVCSVSIQETSQPGCMGLCPGPFAHRMVGTFHRCRTSVSLERSYRTEVGRVTFAVHCSGQFCLEDRIWKNIKFRSFNPPSRNVTVKQMGHLKTFKAIHVLPFDNHGSGRRGPLEDYLSSSTNRR